MLELGPAARTQKSHSWNDELDWSLEDRQVANTPCLQVVNSCNPLSTAAATAQHPGHRFESDHAPNGTCSTHFLIRLDLVAFPSSEPRNTLGRGHGCPLQFGVSTTSN